MEASEEVAGGFFVARCDGAELFDPIEESFDEIAFGIKREVAVPLGLAVGLGRDDRGDGANLEAFDEAVAIVALVGDEALGFDLRCQGFGLREVVGMAAGEA